jgi:hypothetical protein
MKTNELSCFRDELLKGKGIDEEIMNHEAGSTHGWRAGRDLSPRLQDYSGAGSIHRGQDGVTDRACPEMTAGGGRATFTRAVHTTPHRLSVGSGEKMSRFVDSKNFKWQVTHYPIAKWPDEPIALWPDSSWFVYSDDKEAAGTRRPIFGVSLI